jgi:adenylate cyclase
MDKRFAIGGVSAGTPLSEAAPLILLAKAKPLFELEAETRGGADMDAVHDMRVASRRLREAMRLLSPLYPRKKFKAWYRSVRSITRTLGPVRDSDVFIDAFRNLGAELGEGGTRCISFMVDQRIAQRERELERLNEKLSSLDLKRNRRSFEKLVHDIAESPWSARSLADFAHAEVSARAATVLGAQPGALEETNIGQQHALRIDYKRLRYAVEAFAPCYGDDFDALHETLTAFQDALGDLHDIHVFLDTLRASEHTAGLVRAGVTPGECAEVEALLGSRAHQTFLRFNRLAQEHGPEALLPDLLLPLRDTSGADAAAASPTEIERKFLVSELPPDLLAHPVVHVRQGYLAIGPDGEVRVRDASGRHTLTVKSQGSLVRREHEISLVRKQFDRLWPATEGRRIEKWRYAVPLGAVEASVDVYAGDLDGLVTVEVEFPSEQDAREFQAPGWFAAEVTEDPSYKNATLSVQGRPSSALPGSAP